MDFPGSSTGKEAGIHHIILIAKAKKKNIYSDI